MRLHKVLLHLGRVVKVLVAILALNQVREVDGTGPKN